MFMSEAVDPALIATYNFIVRKVSEAHQRNPRLAVLKAEICRLGIVIDKADCDEDRLAAIAKQDKACWELLEESNKAK